MSTKRRYNVSLGYHKEVVKQLALMPGSGGNTTLLAITDKIDPSDYFLEEGFSVGFSTRLFSKLNISTTYRDYLQSSLENRTEFSLFRKSKEHRPNPPIDNGRLRSLSAETVWDTRPLMKNKGQIIKMDMASYAVFKAGFEYAGPDLADNDFHYKRYFASFRYNQRLFGLGHSQIYLFGGLSDGNLPTQRRFMYDHSGYVFSHPLSFKTMGENNFSGDKSGAFYVFHDFGQNLFEWSHLPLIKDIPFSLAVFGGAFWTSFENENDTQNLASYGVAEKAYHEIGFSIGRITSLRLRVDFSWQLSNYDTEKFAITVGGGLF